MNGIPERSPVTVLAEAVRSRRASALDLTEEAIRRIETSDPTISAVVAMRSEQALEDADRLDRSIVSGAPVGSLAGVPVLVKDMEDVHGMRTTFGSRLFADAPLAEADSAIPGRLRKAGAVIIGKTNLPEFAVEGFTDNLVFGPTRNPWALEWSPGGSSGGSAAAIAAGMVPTATGTDGGGSIRIPAAFCGLVGLKPTAGLVSRDTAPDWIDLTTHGPFATSVEDLRRLLRVWVGDWVGDPNAGPSDWEGRARGRRPGRLFAAFRTSDLGPLPAEVERTFVDAVDAMARVLDLPVTWLESDLFAAGDPDLDWFTLAAAEHVNALGRQRIESALGELHPSSRAFMESGLKVTIDDYISARRRRFSYVRRLDDLLGTADLLLTPTVASAGWYADGRRALDAQPGSLPPEVYSTVLQNVTGHPAISLPAGVSANGVPFGLQITAPRYSDGELLDIAEIWELAHPWRPVAPGFEPFATRWT